MSLTYEMSTRVPAQPDEDVERDRTDREIGLPIAGVPLWMVRRLVRLRETDLATHADVARWQRIHAAVRAAIDRAENLIEERRAELLLQPTPPDDEIPAFLRLQAD